MINQRTFSCFFSFRSGGAEVEQGINCKGKVLTTAELWNVINSNMIQSKIWHTCLVMTPGLKVPN